MKNILLYIRDVIIILIALQLLILIGTGIGAFVLWRFPSGYEYHFWTTFRITLFFSIIVVTGQRFLKNI